MAAGGADGGMGVAPHDSGGPQALVSITPITWRGSHGLNLGAHISFLAPLL